MAKDGTVRGGARTGAGRPKKALAEKIATGNPGGRKLSVLDIPDALEGAELEGVDMPPLKDYAQSVHAEDIALRQGSCRFCGGFYRTAKGHQLALSVA